MTEEKQQWQTYNVWRHLEPLKIGDEFAASLLLVGTVDAENGSDAIQQAKLRKFCVAPVVAPQS